MDDRELHQRLEQIREQTQEILNILIEDRELDREQIIIEWYEENIQNKEGTLNHLQHEPELKRYIKQLQKNIEQTQQKETETTDEEYQQ